MISKGNNLFAGSIGILLFLVIIPAFGEVQTIQSDKNSYVLGEMITFSGYVDEEDTGLVTIVIRDPDDSFVQLKQTFSDPENKYEVQFDTSKNFNLIGNYQVSAFIFNLTKGVMTTFSFSHFPESITTENTGNEHSEPEPYMKQPEPKQIIEEPEPEPITSNERNIQSRKIDNTLNVADFVDTEKDPQHYLDRYYTELIYKAWFDRNYPDLTIEKAVQYSPYSKQVNNTIIADGITNTQNEITKTDDIVDSEQVSSIIVQSSSVGVNNSELTQLVFALGGVGILFGAVYGIKKRVDNNSEQISKNKKRLDSKIASTEENLDTIDILKRRLACGEINLKEFVEIKNTIEKRWQSF